MDQQINPKRPFPKKIVFVGAIGGAIEFYDFTLYGVLAGSFAPLFFPASSYFLSLLNAYAVFAVGFFARPLGALIFGNIGDKLGRKVALFWSLILMSFATLTIGLLPSYETIGYWAPALMVFSRLIQGISAGGEYSGALIFAIEHGDKKRSGLVGSSVTTGCMSGLVLGSLAGFACSLPGLPVWSWRVPFIIGFVISLIGMYIRFRLEETPEYLSIRTQSENKTQKCLAGQESSLLTMFRNSFRSVLAVIFLSGFNGVALYLYFIFMSSFVAQVTNVPEATAKLYSCVGTAVLMSTLMFFGNISDKFNRSYMVLAGTISTIITALLLFYTLSTSSTTLILLSQLAFVISLGMYGGPLNTFIIELFGVGIRYRCAAIGYSLGMGFLGGSAPLVASLLSTSKNNHFFLSLYVGVAGCFALLGLWMLRQRERV